MIESIYTSRSALAEIDRSPFGPFVRTLARDYLSDGYHPCNIKGSFTIILPFVRWTAHMGISPRELRIGHAASFFSSEYPATRPAKTKGRRCIQRLLVLIENKFGSRLIEKPIKPHERNPFVVKATLKFEKYMLDVKGLLPTSIARFKTSVAQFLTFVFPEGAVDARRIEAKHILDFLRTRGQRFQHKTIRADASGIKCYLRFLYGKRLIMNDLSHVVPRIACWRNQSVIHTVSEAEMVRMLKSCNQDEPVGVRDYSVLLLLMRYGLRPIEVSRLELDDIRWSEKRLVIKGKGRKGAVLPLEDDAAAALRRYIDEARPLSNETRVYLRAKAPFVPLSYSAAISAIVRHSIQRAGLSPQIFGARLLRYSVASAILNRGGTLMEVAELLRHSSLNTTARYTRLDFERLKLVPLEWPT